MKAMILAAGFGTRLRPITYFLPKPVVPLCNRPIIEHAALNLQAAGATEIVVNLHHLPEAIERLLTSRVTGVRFTFSREETILGTGGGIRRVRDLLRAEPDFFVVNGDTIQFPPYEELRRVRRETNALAALAVRRPPAGDRFTPVYCEPGRITGFGSGTGEPLMFSGAHAISGRIFDVMPELDEFSIVDSVYVPRLADDVIVAVQDDGPWFDIGTPRRYLEASMALAERLGAIAETARPGTRTLRSVVGERSVVEGDVAESIIWSGARIGPGVRMRRCIVTDDVELTGDLDLEDSIVCLDDSRIPQEGYQRRDGLVIARF